VHTEKGSTILIVTLSNIIVQLLLIGYMSVMLSSLTLLLESRYSSVVELSVDGAAANNSNVQMVIITLIFHESVKV
jgi:hypothetical protein